MVFPAYQPATRCSGSAAPGALALMKFFLDEYGDDGGYNLGIYNCRPVRGGSTWSLHSEGRADDCGFRFVNDKVNPAMGRFVQRIRRHARELGIQCIIADRRIYSAKSPGRGGRPYTGVSPHRDHAHVELTRNGGANLTVATIRQVLQDAVRDTAPAPVKAKPGARPVKAGSRTLRRGSAGKDVAFLQRFLGLKPDATFGAKTEAAVGRYQKMRGLALDGVCGPKTWAHILGRAS